jgi:hypothetical protein
MESRLKLQTELERILGSKNVYFQPPESVKIKYPAIVYSLNNINNNFANNSIYKKSDCYNVTLIDKDPESPYADIILNMPMCSFDRAYASDNLNHFVFTLYY